jgi:hypothetical protein
MRTLHLPQPSYVRGRGQFSPRLLRPQPCIPAGHLWRESDLRQHELRRCFFWAATFGGEASFGYASFSQMLSCTEVTFSKEANLRNISCEGTAFFRSATFKGEAHFTFASIGRNLNCTRGTFNDHVNFSGAAVSQALQLVRVSTSRYVDLYQCKMARLELGSTYTFDEGSHVDLRGCYIESFLGEPDVARAFVKSQRPDEFSRDPYLNLERYYRTIGNEFEAKKIHYLGRSELRGCLRSPNRLLK